MPDLTACPSRFSEPLAATRLLRFAWPLLLILGCKQASEGSDTSVVDSNSNWLKTCSANLDCGGRYSCVNRLCMLDCTTDEACGAQASECRTLQPLDGCFEPTTGAGQCLAACEDSAQCQALNATLVCEQGVCVSQPESCAATEPTVSTAAPSTLPPDSGADPNQPTGDASAGGAGGTSSLPTAAPSVLPTNDASAPATLPREPDAGSTAEVDAAVSCPGVADACPDGCSEVTALGMTAGTDCFSPAPSVLACRDPNSAATDDANCLRAADGSLYIGVSGTFAGPLVDSGGYTLCSDEEWALVDAAGSCEESPSGMEAGTATAVAYSVDMTNGTGCCDFFTLIKSDPENDRCAFVEIRVEVGDAPVATGASVAPYAADCWQQLASASALDTAVQGEVSVVYAAGGNTLSANLSFELPTPPQTVELVVVDLPVDRQWHPEP